MSAGSAAAAVIQRAAALRGGLNASFRDEAVRSIYSEAARVAHRAVQETDRRKFDLDQRIDRLVTSPVFGLPIMGYGVIYNHILIALGGAIVLLAAFGWALEPSYADESDYEPPVDGGTTKELAPLG